LIEQPDFTEDDLAAADRALDRLFADHPANKNKKPDRSQAG
jgi:hypothetical protein